MGEEYAEESPFLYFISHTDPALVEAVRQGRKREFAEFHSTGEPPDAYDRETFQHCKLHWEQRNEGKQGVLRKFYQQLIHLRRNIPALKELTRQGLTVTMPAELVIAIHRVCGTSEVFYTMNFAAVPTPVRLTLPPGRWQTCLDSSDIVWSDPSVAALSPYSAIPMVQGEELISLILPPHNITLYQRD